jgi:hypothetical protein
MRSWIEALARTGYAARGVVYVVIGFLAVLAAFGRSETPDTQSALEALLAQPFGTLLLWLIALGLACFAVWRVVQGLRDTDDHGGDAKGMAIRAGLLLSAVSYAALAVLAASLVSAFGGGEGSDDPSGRWLGAVHGAGLAWLAVYVVAALLFVVGAAHIAKGLRAGFEKYFRCGEDVMRWLKPLARFGLIARGIVFLIIAGLIFRGGLAYDAEQQPGLGDALRAVQTYAFGWFLFLAIGLGLLAFGGYSLAEARYRHVSAH